MLGYRLNCLRPSNGDIADGSQPFLMEETIYVLGHCVPLRPYTVNDQDNSPLINDDSRFQLISTVVRWLEYWKGLPYTQGKLTAQTFSSF